MTAKLLRAADGRMVLGLATAYALDMALIQLPHTAGCIVCGRDNAIGLRLTSFVDPEIGVVTTTYTPKPEHIGFHGIVHGGVVSTVLDELMVWCAIWAARRGCLAAELNVRFLKPVQVGVPTEVEARIELQRPRLIATAGIIRQNGQDVASATGKYMPMAVVQSDAMFQTFVREPQTEAAMRHLAGQ